MDAVLSKKSALWAAILILAIGRLFVPVLREGPHGRVRFAEAVNTAYALYKYGEFKNPFAALPTGPTAHVAPLFPMYLAAVFRVFGDGARSTRVIALAEAAAIVAQIALLPMLGEALGVGASPGFVAAFFAIAGARRMAESEANFTALLLMLATLLAYRFCRAVSAAEPPSSFGRRSAWRIAWLSGALWGVILLLNPAAGGVWIAWLVLGIVWFIKGGAARGGEQRSALLPALPAGKGRAGDLFASMQTACALRFAGCYLGVPLLVISPWTARNYHVLGGFVAVRSNFGLEMKIGNNPCAAVTLRLNAQSNCYPHPSIDLTEARKVAQLGEIQYNREQMAQALAWIWDNPRRVAFLWTKRIEVFWFPSESAQPIASLLSGDHWLWRWMIDLCTLLSVPGIFVFYRANSRAAAICLAFLLVYPIPYYFVQYDPRYRYPIVWVTFLVGAIGACWLFGSLRARLRRGGPPRSR